MRRIALYVLAALALVVVALNWTYGRLPGEPKPTGSFVQIGKLRIHYLERPGTGTPVVLIHGLPGTAEDFNTVTPLLTGHRTIAFDRPGFGYSGHGYLKFDRQVQSTRRADASAARAAADPRRTLPTAARSRSATPSAITRCEASCWSLGTAAAGQHLGTYDECRRTWSKSSCSCR